MRKLLCTLTLLFFAIGATQAQQDIDLQGNTTSIADGDTTPDLADHTDFDNVTVGSSLTRTFTIQNTGTADLNLTSIGKSLGSNSQFTVDFSGVITPVGVGNSTTFTVKFTPTVAGLATGGIVVVSDGPSPKDQYTFSIQATGVLLAIPDINIQGNGNDIVDGDITPSLTDHTQFGQIAVGSTFTRTFTIQNTGGVDLDLSSIGTGLGNNAQFTVDSGSTITPVTSGNSTTFTVTFTATSVGVATGKIVISSNDPDTESTYTFDVEAEGIDAQDINIQGNSIDVIDGDITPSLLDHTDFDQVSIGSSLTRTFTIQNTGNLDLNLSGANLSLGSNSQFTLDNTSISTPVTSGNSTTFTVTFTPTVVGVVSGGVVVTSDDPDAESTYTFSISAEGVPVLQPDINVQGNSTDINDGDITPDLSDHTDFGSITVGASLTRTFTIFNTGNQDLNLSGVDLSLGTNAEFTIDNTTVGTPVVNGTPTTFTVTFTPTVAGIVTGGVVITSDDPDAESTYTYSIVAQGIAAGIEMDVTGLGNPINDGDLTTSVTNDTDYGSVDVSTGSLTHVFTIENSGSLDLTLTDPSPYITISGVDVADFILVTIPSSPISTGGSTTFSITFDPIGILLTTRNATVSIANDDADENPYTFTISGTAIDANTASPLMITQYYEGAGNDRWIEVKNISTQTITAGVYNLALYINTATRDGVINVNAPSESVGISGALGAIQPGEVILFQNNAGTPALPLGVNLGSAHIIPTAVCSFTGNDVILISTSTGTNCYNDRIDIIGVVPPSGGFPPSWGVNKSLIKGCGTTQQPSLVFDENDFIELLLEEVNLANPLTNAALGTQNIGATVWSGGAWNRGISDRTRNSIINDTYLATDGSFGACNLTINGNLNFNSGTSNYVEVNDNLIINGTFTIGDQESLYSVNVLNPGTDPVSVTGIITKLETTTTLNDSDDYTFWSSPVESANMSTVFAPGTYQQSRLYYWDQLAPNLIPAGGSQLLGEWISATGLTMKPGKGYISQSPEAGTYPLQATVSFSGRPNNGSTDLNASDNDIVFNNNGNADDDLNLVGNPYPSAINADLFINDGNNATSINGTIWFWTHNTPNNQNPTGEQYTNDDYASYNLLGGLLGIPAVGAVVTPNGIIGSGQGFMVQTNSTEELVTFTDGMRVKGQNTQFFRGVNTKKSSIEEKDRIWLNAESSEGGAFSQILVGFVDDATDGIDRVYDGIKISEGWVNLYSKIDTLKYGIQGLSSFSIDKKVPLAFQTYIEDAAVTYKISIDRFEGASLSDNDIYLVDNELNVTHDLKQGAYNFTISSPIDSNDGYMSEDRFILQFTKATLGVDDLELNNDFVVINEENSLLVKSKTIVSELKMYDITGRLLVKILPNKSEFKVNTHNIRKGTVLILNTTFENGTELSKKAIKY